MNLLERLRAVSEIVPETAEITLVEHYRARHVNLSAAGITAAAQLPENAAIVDDAVAWAQKSAGKGANRKRVAIAAVEHLALEFARRLSTIVEGRVSIEVDARLAYKRRALIDRARAMLAQLGEAGVGKDRVLLKIPATWEGIEAAQLLTKKDGAGCHMTLVFGMHQLAACADAGAAIIAPAVGRITDFHKKQDGVEGYEPAADPGARVALAMHAYLVAHGYASELMPATFRGPEQVVAVAGLPYVSVPHKLLELLEATAGELEARTPPEAAAKITVDAAGYQAMHQSDAAAAAKLSAGVQNLSWSVVSQEKQLGDWITARQDRAAESSTIALFRTWDYDGDGYIDREEWNGSEEVFNALDRDNDGRISLEEMAAGLGSPYRPG
jgi:transaldolase